jgi:hypothetical protein
MTAQPLEQYLVEVLQEQPTTIAAESSSGSEIILELSNATLTGEPAVPELIEVAIVPPVGAGIRQIENIPFTRQGQLSTVTAGTEFPIGPGEYLLHSISGRVSTAPTGSAVIFDVLVNNVSVFADPADRPTIPAGQQNAVVGDFGVVMLAEGDYIEVIIAQVGSTYPGETLVASVRLERTA